ncbi:2OG-Fe dioxygenase family protein [Sphingobium sp. JS3065]|uniref:2OG-Fe dioxygenase family protein n=1 Tax=Sphingobium sp. JS3065 TaxID=2970925 RepID=UPI0022644C7D|nr:2OG-Fe dioxygenase family protein [Sphingobium sp. JS3065]UZW56305.1 2OG-Fe dioxygenase family protein [Sphingobium sp. JS3065]
MSDAGILTDISLQHELERAGYARLSGPDLFERLAIRTPDWGIFVQSWDDLGPDLYMADGGRYRRRRHATFACEHGRFTRKPHQPHFQSRDYNPLNGDVQRWFDPVEQATIDNGAMQSIFAFCAASFPLTGPQHVELHQFRIEARSGELGRPTPEGMHRDGVDWVFVMLAERRNVREGVTRIGTPEGTELGEFTLARPGDAVLIDDHRIMHGVTEIHAVDPAQPAWRDALVLTFASE